MHVLLESGARSKTATGRWTLASAAAHAALITAAVLATAQTQAKVFDPVPQDPIIYVAPIEPAPSPAGPTSTWPTLPTRGPVIDIPRIPVPGPVDLSRTTIDPTVIGEIRGGSSLSVPGGPSGPSSGIYSEATVERTVLPWSRNPTPVYPSHLRASGLQGTVVVRFVVDTSGVVEQGSIAVLEATHVAFADAVRAWLPRTRYFPAEVSGRHVRQLVQQRVEFQLER